MNAAPLEVASNVQPLGHEHYAAALDHYLAQIQPNPHVRAVYQIGSIGTPGVSDLDLVVVVDRVRDPFWLKQLSVHATAPPDLVRYIFPHDVYVYDVASFRNVRQTLFADNLTLRYGEPQPVTPADPDEMRWLSLQILFDFTVSRLAQFKSMLATGKIDVRGVLLRVASIKHSLALLQNLGEDLPHVSSFADRITAARDDAANVSPDEARALFEEAFTHFSLVAEAAASYFTRHALTYYGDAEISSLLKLNAHQLLRFADGASHVNAPGGDPLTVVYPAAAFFHFLAFTRYDHFVGRSARAHLAYAGDEVYELHAEYERVLRTRLQALSDHYDFLRANDLRFAMSGTPGLLPSWSGPNETAGTLSLPNLETPPVGGYADEARGLLDRRSRVLPFEALQAECEVTVDRLDLDRDEYEHWIERHIPDWSQRHGDKYYKKPLELFITYKLLAPRPTDVFMDAAGGENTYLHCIDVARRYMQNIVVSDELRAAFDADMQFLEGDARHIPVPDASIDKISMHHSFEHFQGTSDVDFIKEVQRILKVGGRCCIVPIFLGDHHVEVSHLPKPECPFDPEAEYIVDPRARLTGGGGSGDFARIYDLSAFHRRVLQQIDAERFQVSLHEVSMGGELVPFEDLPSHATITRINFPYRALLIERIT